MAGKKTTPTEAVYTARRREALGLAGREARVSALLVTRPEDVSYLTGFTGDDSFVLLGASWAALLTDGRYDEQARRECAGVEIVVREGPMSRAVAAAAKAHRVRRLGVQADHITVRMRDAVALAGKSLSIQSVSDVLMLQRAVKDRDEIAALRRAIRVAQDAFCGLISRGARGLAGRTEGQIAAELDHRMRDLGASGPSFETIVAAGANGSLPHYRPSSRVVKRGEALLVDWGAKVAGYCSDLTRVVFIGTIPPKLGEVYDVVLKAQEAGIAAIRPGLACRTADTAARDVIEQAGYGKQFVHSLGHGIGRMIHELPVLGRPIKSRLRSGMVVTVEPGIYLPGVGGVRIEDDVLVTPQGRQRLTTLPRERAAMVLR